MKKIQLSIPEPCHQNWDSMSITQQGRYCNACAKEVIDFSSMSDTEVLNYFLKKKEADKVCGRVFPDQLDRAITAPPTKKWYWQWNYAAMFLFFFFQQDKANAQALKKRMPHATEQNKLKTPKMVGMMLPSPDFISGTVKNSKGQPIAFASVKILHSVKAAKTDEYGNFYLRADSIENILEISSIGYKPWTETMKKTTHKEIVLMENEQILKEVTVAATSYSLRCRVGGIAVSRTSRRKVMADTIKPWLNIFKLSSIKIYPNPVTKGSMFTISMKLKQTGNYTIQITDATGRLLTEKKINAMSKDWNEKMESSSNWAAGVYYVKVMDDKGKLFKTASVAVQ